MKITSVTVRNFKAIREASVPLGDYNVIIGKNDVGKSSLLEAIDLLLNFDTPDNADFHMMDEDNTITIQAEFTGVSDELVNSLSDDYSNGGEFEVIVRHESSGGRYPDTISVNGEEVTAGAILKDDEELTMSDSRDFIKRHLLDAVPVFAERNYADETDLKRGSLLTKLMNPVFNSETIDEKTEEIRAEIEEASEEIGIQINATLSDQHPVLNNVSIGVGRFDLSKAVTPEVEVRDGNLDEWMSLSERGSGVGNQFILAMMQAYADSEFDDYCVLFEEPENSLHPSAVREMGRALKEISRGGGQVILTSHSPSLINSHGNGNLIVASNDEGLAEFELLGEDQFRAIETIGAKNSDLLQSDYVLYTEGASDAAVFETICEQEFRDWDNLNITIQPAGGSNLEHQMEHMKEINRHSGILIDSDRYSADAELGGQATTLQELAEEFDVDYWILRRTKVENYFHPDAVEEVLETSGVTIQNYEDAEGYLVAHHGYGNGEKVSNARRITVEMFESELDDELDEIKGYLEEVVDIAGS